MNIQGFVGVTLVKSMVESGKQPFKSSSELPLSCGSGFKSQDYDMWKNEKEERRVGVSFVDDKRKAPNGQ